MKLAGKPDSLWLNVVPNPEICQWLINLLSAIIHSSFALGVPMTNQADLYTKNPSQIVMYSVEWCPDCRRAKFFFKRKKIDVLEVDVNADKRAEAFVKELNNGYRSVPTIIFPDGSMMVEPSTEEMEAKISHNVKVS
jgi:mycoredoxin